MMPAERALVVVLRVGALVTMSAVVAVVMPFAWMAKIHAWLGMGDLPDLPITGYLTRSFSAFYTLHGAMLWVVSTDVRRYDPLVRFLGFASVVFGTSMLALDIAVGMPAQWTACEGPAVIVLGGAILALRRAARRSQEAVSP